MTDKAAFDGDLEHRRVIEDAMAKAMLYRLRDKGLGAEGLTPPPLKWAGMIVGAIMTAGSLAMAIWVVSSISSMQVTLARMDERQALTSATLVERFQVIDSRLERLEQTGAPSR